MHVQVELPQVELPPGVAGPLGAVGQPYVAGEEAGWVRARTRFGPDYLSAELIYCLNCGKHGISYTLTPYQSYCYIF